MDNNMKKRWISLYVEKPGWCTFEDFRFIFREML